MEEIENIKKTKRNRKPTTCLSKTKSGHSNYCSLCGSENLIEHGVESCTICSYEEYFIRPVQDSFYAKCINHSEHNRKSKRKFWRTLNTFSIVACSDCGATKSGKCPNCDLTTGQAPWLPSYF